MIRFLLTRLLAAIPVLLVVSLVVFAVQALSPGDPARLLLQASGVFPVSDEARAAKRHELGLDRPWPERYLTWGADAARGDLGRSYRTYEPVTRLYLDRLPATAALAIVASSFSALVAVPLGLFAAYRRGSLLDTLAQFLSAGGIAIPGFWLGFILIFVFAAKLGWLPVFGSISPRGIVLPALVLALPSVAVLTRLVRAATLDVLGQDFVLVARAKGLATPVIARRHVLPNALLPAVTVFGMEVAGLFAGAAVVEYVFAYPGIGKLAIESALVHDAPVVAGFALAAALILVAANLVVDLAVADLDPRVGR